MSKHGVLWKAQQLLYTQVNVKQKNTQIFLTKFIALFVSNYRGIDLQSNLLNQWYIRSMANPHNSELSNFISINYNQNVFQGTPICMTAHHLRGGVVVSSSIIGSASANERQIEAKIKITKVVFIFSVNNSERTKNMFP